MKTKGFFQFDIIIKFLVNRFRFILIPMLLVSDQYKYFHYFSAVIDFRRQNLTSKVGPHTERFKTQLVLFIFLFFYFCFIY